MSHSNLSDIQRIQGKWRPARFETFGYQADAEQGTGDMVFALDQVTTPGGVTFRFRLDSTQEPKQLDFFDALTGKAKFHGIYRFQDEQLIICFNQPSAPRPASFTTSKEVTDVMTSYEKIDG